MTEPRILGHSQSGVPIRDADVERLAAEAETGYDVDDLIARRGKRGRPPIGSTAATVESVRLDPELRAELSALSSSSGATTSALIRLALRRYLASEMSSSKSVAVSFRGWLAVTPDGERTAFALKRDAQNAVITGTDRNPGQPRSRKPEKR